MSDARRRTRTRDCEIDAGDADTREKNKPPPPAGYGAIATEGGGVGEIFRIGGQIVAGRTSNVKTTTANLADLVAFTRALQWAHSHSRAQGRPICLRYNSEYAARIATGTWSATEQPEERESARQGGPLPHSPIHHHQSG